MGATDLRSQLVLKKEEEALIHLMKNRALKKCKDEQKAYADCVRGRGISLVWVCRESANAMGACLTGHTDAAALEALKQRWVKAGKPNLSDNPDF